MRNIFSLCVFIVAFSAFALGKEKNAKSHILTWRVLATSPDTVLSDSLKRVDAQTAKTISAKPAHTSGKLFPSITPQQFMKGKHSGLYIQESSGEPGTYQNMFVRGTSTPLLNQFDLIKAQPLIVVDGLPIISNESPIAYDIQQYSFNRIGPATNLLAGVNTEDILSVEVFKDFSQTAMYGPRAANGVVYIRTKPASSVTRVGFNTYFGLVTRPSVVTTNGQFENAFRESFYNRYASTSQIQSYPAFLRDSLTNVYYGPSNWTDKYYRNAIVYNADASVSGGTDRANFKFNVGSQKNSGNADATGLSKYYSSIDLNIIPKTWLEVSANIKGTRLNRERNKYNRDRLAEVRYFPELSQAPAPNLESYNNFLFEYDKSLDENFNNIANGFLNIAIRLPHAVKFNTRFGTSYNEGGRDVFYPGTLMDAANYSSNYFGVSRRLLFDNTLAYKYVPKKDHQLDFLIGQSAQWDKDTYNYAYAYRGVSDYLKVNLLKKADESFASNGAFDQRLVSKFADQTQHNILSFYGNTQYNYKNIYSASLLLRADGSSNMQPVHRWFYSPVLSASWNIKNDKLQKFEGISSLVLKGGYGRIGIADMNDRNAQGSTYTADLGWTNEPRIASYLGVAPLSRTYTYGYVGYDLPWAYNEQFTLGIDFGIFNSKLRGSLSTYSTATKNQSILMPQGAEYGYNGLVLSGMDINNSGIDLLLSSDISNKTKFKWNSSINFNVNQNRLTALPDGRSEIVVGNRKLEVGKSADQYWLLKNEGIYTSDEEVPLSPSGKRLTYKTLPLKAGDPKWADTNGDFNVDDDDKVLTGHILPVLSGGFSNSFRYNKWNLETDLYFNIGRQIINQNMANRFNFINRENANDINSVKEITFWEKQGEYGLYPKYNPWSPVVPYRPEQDLFLENASFLKLRNISIGYDATSLLKNKKNVTRFKSFYVFATANNLFTLTSYTGRDPELVDFNGYDSGYGLPIPVTFTGGVKVDFK